MVVPPAVSCTGVVCGEAVTTGAVVRTGGSSASTPRVFCWPLQEVKPAPLSARKPVLPDQ